MTALLSEQSIPLTRFTLTFEALSSTAEKYLRSIGDEASHNLLERINAMRADKNQLRAPLESKDPRKDILCRCGELIASACPPQSDFLDAIETYTHKSFTVGHIDLTVEQITFPHRGANFFTA